MLIVKNVYGRPPTKGVDTGPSCKELVLFNKYNCFSFDLHVCRLILESERPTPGLRVRFAIFHPKQTPIYQS